MKKLFKRSKNKTKNYKDGVYTPAPHRFLAGAEHYEQDDDMKIWKPSNNAVEEMRDFSAENRL